MVELNLIIYEIKYKTNVVTQSFMPEFTDNLRTTKVLLTKFDRLVCFRREKGLTVWFAFDEKLFIMKFKKNSLLNKRSEIFSNFVHKKQFLAGKYIRVQSNNVRHHTRRKNAQACTRKQTKPNGQI